MPRHALLHLKLVVSFSGPLGLVLVVTSLTWGSDALVATPAPLIEPQTIRGEIIIEPAPAEVSSGRSLPQGERQAKSTNPAGPGPTPTAPPYPLEVNETVNRFLTLFQSAQKREIVERWLSRSGRYLGMIREAFRQKGLPEDLAYTAMIESGFNPVAVSRAGAKGLWQFMEGTARRYGLTVDRWVDERLDPEKSTHAAAEYLKDLFDQFGSWFLAQAAYNAGEVKVAQAIQRSGSRDFWRLTQTRHLLEETKRFVPAIVAATLIAKEPDRYGFRVSYQKPEPVDVVTVPVSLALRTIAQWTGVAVETLHALNPELRRGVTPPTGPYAVKLPPGSRERVEERMALFRPGAEESFTVHRVHQGQNLAQVARLYRTTPQELQALNGLTGGTLRAGTEVIVPALASAPSSQASKHSTQARAVSATVVRSAPSIYTVRPGDTLGGIALRHQLSPSEIARWNGLADNAIIYPGDSLRLTPEAQSGS